MRERERERERWGKVAKIDVEGVRDREDELERVGRFQIRNH